MLSSALKEFNLLSAVSPNISTAGGIIAMWALLNYVYFIIFQSDATAPFYLITLALLLVCGLFSSSLFHLSGPDVLALLLLFLHFILDNRKGMTAHQKKIYLLCAAVTISSLNWAYGMFHANISFESPIHYIGQSGTSYIMTLFQSVLVYAVVIGISSTLLQEANTGVKNNSTTKGPYDSTPKNPGENRHWGHTLVVLVPPARFLLSRKLNSTP